jgi:YegS/Rv2252/BmrU family lipid kinase
MPSQSLKILFIINPGAGKNTTNWQEEINKYFMELPHKIEMCEIPDPCDPNTIRQKIKESKPDMLVAVGGDGTLKLVVNSIKGEKIPVGLIPAGSANGMAKELKIPLEPVAAMENLLSGVHKKIHLVSVNNELCIHLSDIGFNAFVVKKFEDENKRGMWGYIKAAWKVLWNYSKMNVEIKVDDVYILRKAAMVVIANGTQYGTGVVINPEGRLDDDKFEIIILKEVSFAEIFKMRFTQKPYHPAKTELIQTRSLKITSHHKVHFQVDGEYMGKVNTITADILPDALEIIVPVEEVKK